VNLGYRTVSELGTGGNYLIQPRKYWARVSILSLAMAALPLTGCTSRGSDKDVMAKVNGYKILRSEVDKTYNTQVAGSPQKPTPTEEEALRLNVLGQIIYNQLQLQKAEKLGIVASEDEVESKFNQAKAPYTQEQFQKLLKDRGLSEEDYKLEIRRNLTVDKLLNKEIASKVTISDSDIQNYYNQNKAEFNLIEPRYNLATIFVSNQPTNEQGTAVDRAQLDAQAKKKIQIIYNRLESGEDFTELAQKYSEDPDTARSGGVVGPVPETLRSITTTRTRYLKIPEQNKSYSTSASDCPASTAAPSATLIFFTTPFFGAFNSFCIFMASITTRLCPAST
jgi:peptidyl-prolyl cis-trans isomerase SurA